MEEFKQGIDLQKQSNLFFGDWLLNWMENYKKNEIRINTWENYMQIVRTHIYPELGHISLRDLQTDHIQRLYNNMADNGLSSATIRRAHHIINGCLNQAIKNKLISWNPNQATTPPKVKKKEKRPMTNEELDKFLAVLENDKWGVALLTSLGTGLRRGELLALRWEDIDFEKGIVYPKRSLVYTKEKGLHFDEPKTQHSKKPIPIPSFLIEELKKTRPN